MWTITSATRVSNTPTAIRSSRLTRTAVSDTYRPRSRSASFRLRPVTSRTSSTSKPSRSDALPRWHPRGWFSGWGRIFGSTTAQTGSTTSGSLAHDGGVSPPGRWFVGKHPDDLGVNSTANGWSRPVLGNTRESRVVTPVHATSKRGYGQPTRTVSASSAGTSTRGPTCRATAPPICEPSSGASTPSSFAVSTGHPPTRSTTMLSR